MIGVTANMGEVSMTVTGLLPKISSLFNNRIFSDVEFIFMNTGETQRIYGHKLILALRSEVFASMFFDKKETYYEVRLPASKKSAFSHLLRFLYTDNVQFHTLEEAHELHDLANEYKVEELIKKCSNYILQERLTIENIFPKYECALRKNMWMLLKKCQDFVCSNTQLLFQSVHFKSAPVNVVEDIVKQSNLSVSSELEVIGAVLQWGSEEMMRRKIPDDEKHLRPCIEPFMKHIRFLTLSDLEFDKFVQNFDIFSGYESSILTRKILHPQSNVSFPESLCSIAIKRGINHETESMPSVILVKNTPLDPFLKSTSYDPPVKALPISFPNSIPPVSSSKTSPVSSSKTSPVSPSKISPFLYNSKSTTYISDAKPQISNVPESPTTCANKISYQVKKFSPFNESNVSSSQIKQTIFKSSPNIVDRTCFSPSIMHDNSHRREYEFPLLESEPCLTTSFPKDVKSTVSFKMKTGNIQLYGFELKIKNNSRVVEELRFDVDLKGFSKQPLSQLYKKELKNNVLTVRFSEKMVLQEGCKGELEVSMDNLSLKRCSTCNIINNKINNGLNFACEIFLSSTVKKDDNSFPFLISKLIYVPC